MKKLPLLFLILLSCQGPWSYYPEDPEVYQGIWTSAYVISGRPMEDVCFDRIHALDEIRMPAFAFYEEASVKVTGAFTGKDTSFYLQPDIANRKPNCFVGPKDLVAMPGKNYELDVSITWDSLGKKTTSNFSAKTYIPQKFKVLRAYDLLERQHSRESFLWPQFAYLPPPMDMRSNYFIPEYSDDVAGVQVSMVYDDRVTWGENFIMQIIERFDIEEGADTARYAKFGDRNHVYFARNMEIAGTVKDIDSIPVLGFLTPADGYFKLLFYATTNDYVKYRDTYLNGHNDSRVKAVYNIQGGAGIFAGMLVDTFNIYIRPLGEMKLYGYHEAQDAYCRTLEFGQSAENYKIRRQCLEIWDAILWCEVLRGRPSSGIVCGFDYYLGRPWYNLPAERLKQLLTPSEFITWCRYRDFPIYEYPACGSAMVRHSKSGVKSPILDREVKKWCEANKDDVECGA